MRVQLIFPISYRRMKKYQMKGVYEFEDKYGFLKGNLFVGLVWTFWHAILWVVDSDYTSGMEMIIYILSNVVCYGSDPGVLSLSPYSGADGE